MGKNTKRTSSKVASQAAATLSDPNASATAKSLAASALAQQTNWGCHGRQGVQSPAKRQVQ